MKRYASLEDHVQQIKSDYHHLLYRRNVQSTFVVDGTHLEGVISGVDDSGRLLVIHEDHEVAYQHGEISIVTGI